MTVVNINTGEAIDTLNRDDAERLSNRISARLDVIADNYTAVMPMIREAIVRQAHAALGYRSPGDYARERFGDALAKLDPTMRREVVRELTEAGMSVRAIAPVVGVGKSQVAKDQRQVSTSGHLTSLPTLAEHMAKHQTSRETSVSVADEEAVAATTETTEGADAGRSANYDPRPPVVGIDGKSYSRPVDEAEVNRERELDRGRRATVQAITDATYRLANDPDNYVRHFLPHEPRFVAEQMRLTPERIDAAIHFLTTVRKAVQS